MTQQSLFSELDKTSRDAESVITSQIIPKCFFFFFNGNLFIYFAKGLRGCMRPIVDSNKRSKVA